MLRKIISIDEEKCSGCGLCADACHERAIEIINGKARLIKDDYCDGLGDCLPACPAGAISFVTREAAAYDEKAVQARKQSISAVAADAPREKASAASALAQWPAQIKLMPVTAPYYNGASLLVAADCTAFAYAAVHDDFMRGRVTVIGCPKLDTCDYSEKLARIISDNDIKDICVLRMEVPCCKGLENAVMKAVADSGKPLAVSTAVISVRGEIIKA